MYDEDAGPAIEGGVESYQQTGEDPYSDVALVTPGPDEPRYCYCNQVSFGEMVGCDNDDCPIEWFHYKCVGITEPPKGKWYCKECEAKMKRKRTH